VPLPWSTIPQEVILPWTGRHLGGLVPRTLRSVTTEALSIEPSPSEILCAQRLTGMFSEKEKRAGRSRAPWPFGCLSKHVETHANLVIPGAGAGRGGRTPDLVNAGQAPNRQASRAPPRAGGLGGPTAGPAGRWSRGASGGCLGLPGPRACVPAGPGPQRLAGHGAEQRRAIPCCALFCALRNKPR